MATKAQRTFAAFGAILFLVTSSALTFAVIAQMVQDHKDQQAQQALAKAQTSTPKATETKVENQLQGKPLANFTPVASIPALKTEDTTPGTGPEVKSTDTVTVDYTGAVASTGVVFQSSLDSGQTATFGLDQVIKGWTEGIPGMKVGGTRRLLIPAALAYGANPPSGSGIPANADLVFDVTLHSIK